MAIGGGTGGEQIVSLQNFRLYETRSKFYLVGRDKSRAYWRVLNIDRSDPSELNIREDPTTYSEHECFDLLKRIHDGNKFTGGLKFVTKCYGIGSSSSWGHATCCSLLEEKKLEPYVGHTIYAVSNSEIITLPNSTLLSNMAYSKDENRYKKLLCTVDLTKDFFFSYSYNIMCSLQKNLCDGETGPELYETMFVWNEFLTRGIRNQLKNTTWTIALVYGFLKQAKLSASGKDFRLTLIARRSRHYAGTRYLKRGVNEKGRVANDVETEQIVSQDTLEETPGEVTSIVQNRGSIPLFWSQETSRLNIRPDIILHKKDDNFAATRLHFENLVKRYGNPIIILNLIKVIPGSPADSAGIKQNDVIIQSDGRNIQSFLESFLFRACLEIHKVGGHILDKFILQKLAWELLKKPEGAAANNYLLQYALALSHEKKPRESLLRAEFSNAIDYINKGLDEENRLKFLHWDIQKHSRRKDSNVLALLGKIAAYALNLTGIFYCQLTPVMKIQDAHPIVTRDKHEESPCSSHESNSDATCISGNSSPDDEIQNALIIQSEYSAALSEQSGYCPTKLHQLQKGVLRTNCIDCLDRTNVAQFAYGLAALGHQLYSLGLLCSPKVHLDDPLADNLMVFYERMGDTLALEYGGSAAHNKIFCDVRGQWKAATQSQELLRTLQRYYNNAYMDAEKQNAINMFLGHFQPGKRSLWELGFDQHYNISIHGVTHADKSSRSFIKRSLSDGNILCESSTPGLACDHKTNKLLTAALPPKIKEADIKAHCDSAPEISAGTNGISDSRYEDTGHTCLSENCFDTTNCSNFLHFDLLSLSGNLCEEENNERSSLNNSSANNLSTGSVVSGLTEETTSTSSGDPSEKDSENTSDQTADSGSAQSSGQAEFPAIFEHWVAHGGTFCY